MPWTGLSAINPKNRPRDQSRGPLRLLWHPHQALWNLGLLKYVGNAIGSPLLRDLLIRGIIFVDTCLLWMRALYRRMGKVGAIYLFSRAKTSPAVSILYFDLGTHRAAEELTWMVDHVLPSMGPDFQAFGFEPDRVSFLQAQKQVGANARVLLVNAALCQTRPEGGRLKLYTDGSDGIGNSVYRKGSGHWVEVEAVCLSDWIQAHHLDLKQHVCLLRMNIEGAEIDVITDLVESNLASSIDGYFGLWDDMSKIDATEDENFRRLLTRNRIHPCTFNGRDLEHRFRMRCIAYEVHTAVLAGMNRKMLAPSGDGLQASC